MQGQQAQGRGHTGVALSENAEVVFFNPGGLTGLEANTDISGSVNALDGETAYANSTANVSSDTDSGTGTPVSFYYAHRLDEDLSWGLGIYTPYGSKVEWQRDWAGSHLVNHIELATVYIQPTLSVNLGEGISLGFGPTYITGAVEFNRNLTTSMVDANGNRSNVTLKASGVDAWGYNVGLMAKLGNATQAGVSYRSRSTLEARGESADFENVPGALQSTFSDTTFDADLILPAELTIGIAHKATENLTLAFDYNRTYWDTYNELRIEFANNVPTSVNPRNYKDSSIVRLGAEYHYSEAVTHRLGLYLDESPVRDGYFSPETPRNDSIGLTYGFSYGISEGLVFDASFLYLTFSEVANSYDYYEENGINMPFSGTYQSRVFNAGFGLSYTY